MHACNLTNSLATDPGPALRDYQIRALQDCRAVILAGKRRVLLWAPTGSGKTTIAAKIIWFAIVRGSRVLFLAHRQELLDQCHGRLLEFGIESSIIRANDPRFDPDQAVQVASVQTIVRRLHQFESDDFDLIIVDEAHHTRANTYEKILEHFSGARAVLGLTATPIRQDGRGLAESYDVLVEAASMGELVQLGYLVPVRMYTAPDMDLTGIHRRQGDYVLGELGARMDNAKLVGDIVLEWQRLACDRRTVAFATTVAHSQSITRRFLEAGIRAEHLDGSMDDDERDAILDRVRSGETQVVVNCQLLTEGWDMPEIACCVLARPTKSLGLYLQMAGRALRPAPGKTDCIILDHGNCFREHGGVGDRQWTLTTDKPKTTTGEAPEKSCPGCGLIVPRACRECPECGFVFAGPRWSNQEAAVQLVDASGSDYRRERFFEIVDEVSLRRRWNGEPYKLTAALVIFKQQFGEWPAWSWQREAGIR